MKLAIAKPDSPNGPHRDWRPMWPFLAHLRPGPTPSEGKALGGCEIVAVHRPLLSKIEKAEFSTKQRERAARVQLICRMRRPVIERVPLPKGEGGAKHRVEGVTPHRKQFRLVPLTLPLRGTPLPSGRGTRPKRSFYFGQTVVTDRAFYGAPKSDSKPAFFEEGLSASRAILVLL